MIEAAQFSVHRSPSRSAARPFVVILQANGFSRMPTRIVAPLVVATAMPGFDGENPRVAPRLVVLERTYVLNPFDVATIAVARLGSMVASFAGDDDAKRRIQDALDAVLSPF